MPLNLKYIFSAIIGAVLEFYDFMLYGIFAGVIASVFFNHANPKVALMESLAVLAVGYFTRPLGGLLFGHFGDKYSRRQALTVSLIAMGVITTVIGLLPGYNAWGITAAILLVILRLLQGLTVGGEMPGAMIYLFEAAKPQHRALASSMSLVGAMCGVLLAIMAASIVIHYYTAVEIQHYAWRLPFVFGILLAIVGSYLRLKLWQDNTTEPVKLPMALLFKHYWRAVILSMVFLSMAALYTGIISIYFVPFVTLYFHVSLAYATTLELYLTLLTMLSLPLGAWLVDLLQCYRAWLLVGTLLLAVVSYPLFLWMSYHSGSLLLGFSILVVLACLVMGAELVFIIGLFPKSIRYSGVGFTHGAAFSLIGGTSPLLLNYAVEHWGNAAPGLLFAITAVLAFFAVLLAKKNYA